MQDFPKDGEIVIDYSEVELAGMLADKLGNFDITEIAPEGVKEIYQGLAGVDGLLDYLKDTMIQDIKRYFAATTDHDRDLIRGAFSRTSYMRARILDTLGKK